MKDPAFLFYSQDFIVGTLTMTFEDKGKYITILSLMHQQGRLDEKTISLLVGSISDTLRNKFSIDENGFWFNDRLEQEIEKRTKFIESRINNGIKGGRPKKEHKPNGLASAKLIENENENVNDIISYLNNKTGKNFKLGSVKTKKIVLARLKENYSIEQFKKVIDIKTDKWLHDPKMNDYLRPETLFGSKFESYLNEIHVRLNEPLYQQKTLAR
jgi:uncharacterized phage protein (TIGR02220 family)